MKSVQKCRGFDRFSAPCRDRNNEAVNDGKTLHERISET